MRIYLDHNATTPMDPRVLEAMQPWFLGHHGNPSSLHAEGREARRAVEEARESVAALLGQDPRTILFTSGATEANNTALRGLLAAGADSDAGPAHLAVSAVEHPSVLTCAEALQREGVRVTHLTVDEDGRVHLEAVDAALADGARVVAVMAANNEVGTLQPWSEIADRCRAAGAALHVDAVQMIGKHPLAVPDPGAGTLSLSAHKFGGPKGAGALWIREETRLTPLLFGGGQERLRRGGTENVVGLIGLGAAARLAAGETASRRRRLTALENAFLGAIRERIPDVVLHGPSGATEGGRLAGTLCLRVPGVPGEPLLMGLDLQGVAISLGSACSSGAVEPSHVLHAMEINKVDNLESFRVSLGWEQDEATVLRAARIIADVADRNRKPPDGLGR
ncbi:MAG: cysteine desulfurase [Planctomycetes bacterium]|nr:cysteine desulfurase [Planctomycetota bacterium]